jgi:hypothetical protein
VAKGETADLRSAAEAAAQALVSLAQDLGSADDVSVVVNVYEWGRGSSRGERVPSSCPWS